MFTIFNKDNKAIYETPSRSEALRIARVRPSAEYVQFVSKEERKNIEWEEGYWFF